MVVRMIQTTWKRWRKKWSKRKRKKIGGLRDKACEERLEEIVWSGKDQKA